MITGKVYTRDEIKNRPYYVIKYDEHTDNDGCVVPGYEKWVAHNVSWEFLDKMTEKLLKSIKGIENLLVENEALEIDFTIKNDGEHDIGKIRALEGISDIPRPMSDKEFKDTKAFAKCNYLDFHHILSDGSFCDTERLLGNNPRPLEYSVYKELVDTGAWSENIRRLGYEGTTEEIIVKIGNKPYASINNIIKSFFPKNIDVMLRYKLENYYEKEIAAVEKPEKYFEQNIIISAYGFDTEEKLNRMLSYDFSIDEVNELKNAFYDITKNIVDGYADMSSDVSEDLIRLAVVRENIIAQNPYDETNSMKIFKNIEALISAVKRYGMGNIICMEQCISIAKGFYGVFAKGDNSHRAILYNVNRKMWSSEKRSDIVKSVMDIRDRARQSGSKYVKRLKKEKSVNISAKDLDKYIKEADMDIDAERLAAFIKGSIADVRKCLEEYIQCIELINDMIIRLGEIMGIAYEDMSYLEIQDLLGYHSRNSYIQIINSRRRMYHANTYVELPSLIRSVGDIDIIDNY